MAKAGRVDVLNHLKDAVTTRHVEQEFGRKAPKYLAAVTAAVAAGRLKVVPAILQEPARSSYDALAQRFGATDAELVVLALQTKSPLLTNEKNLITATERLGGNAFDLVDLIHDLQAATKLSMKDAKS